MTRTTVVGYPCSGVWQGGAWYGVAPWYGSGSVSPLCLHCVSTVATVPPSMDSTVATVPPSMDSTVAPLWLHCSPLWLHCSPLWSRCWPLWSRCWPWWSRWWPWWPLVFGGLHGQRIRYRNVCHQVLRNKRQIIQW